MRKINGIRYSIVIIVFKHSVELGTTTIILALVRLKQEDLHEFKDWTA